MGVDLGVEHLQLAAALLLLLLDDVVHQVAQGGHHGADGPAEPLHLVAAALHVHLHSLPACLQLLHRLVQAADGVGDVCGHPEVEEGHQEGGEQQQGQPKEQYRVRLPPQRGTGRNPHQLPAGVPHRLDRHLPGLPLEALLVGAVGVARRRHVVLLQQPRVDELLPGVIDQLPLPADQIYVPAVGQLHLPAHLGDAVEAHVHQQYAALGVPAPGELHLTAEGHHPAVAVIRVIKQLLDVGGGKVEVFHPFRRRPEPAALAGLRRRLHARQRSRLHQPPRRVEQGDGHQRVPVLLIEQPHLLIQGVRGQVGILDDPVIHGVGHPHHPAQIAVQVQVHLGQHPPGGLLAQVPGGVGKAQQQAASHENHAHQGHGGKREGEHHLYAHPLVPLHHPARQALEQPAHIRSPSPRPSSLPFPRPVFGR